MIRHTNDILLVQTHKYPEFGRFGRNALGVGRIRAAHRPSLVLKFSLPKQWYHMKMQSATKMHKDVIKIAYIVITMSEM